MGAATVLLRCISILYRDIMSDTTEKLKHLLEAYDDEIITNGEFQAYAFLILMEDELLPLKKGHGHAVSTTCDCRYPHNIEDSYVSAELFIHPHGYAIQPKGPWWKQMWNIIVSLFRKPKLIHIRGGC